MHQDSKLLDVNRQRRPGAHSQVIPAPSERQIYTQPEERPQNMSTELCMLVSEQMRRGIKARTNTHATTVCPAVPDPPQPTTPDPPKLSRTKRPELAGLLSPRRDAFHDADL